MQQSVQFASLGNNTKNIGDDIQVLAALQFLPSGIPFINRDRIGDARPEAGTKMILNGWWLHNPAKWPPPPEIDPLILSFYADPGKFENTGRLDYLREQSLNRPVGARDRQTLKMFESAGVDAYLSGCLTLTLKAGGQLVRGDSMIAVDVDAECFRQIPTAEKATHRFGLIRHVLPQTERLRRASALLKKYATAGCVVTTRLHVALPCLALGTPVLVIAPTQPTGRISDWLEHVHHCTKDEFISGRFDFDCNAPPENPVSWTKFVPALLGACEAYTGRKRVPFTELAF